MADCETTPTTDLKHLYANLILIDGGQFSKHFFNLITSALHLFSITTINCLFFVYNQLRIWCTRSTPETRSRSSRGPKMQVNMNKGCGGKVD